MGASSHKIVDITSIFILLAVFTTACASSAAPTGTPTSPPPSATASATPSPTPIPPTATPTVSLPVDVRTPIPPSKDAITKETITQLQEVARYYGDIQYQVKLTQDNNFLFLMDHTGVTKYEYPSMEKIAFVNLPNRSKEFQISNDGNWWLIEDFPDSYLIDTRSSITDPTVYLLNDEVDSTNRLMLSPNGTMFSATDIGTAGYRTDLISTEDFSVLFSFSGSYPGPAIFSNDGTFFAQADVTRGQPGGGAVQVFDMLGFKRVISIPTQYPFHITGLSFSHNNQFLAVAQMQAIAVHSLPDGEARIRMTDLCEGTNRQVAFAANSSDILLESSFCGSGRWWLSQGSPSALSGPYFEFDKSIYAANGAPTHIFYPHPTQPALFPSYRDVKFITFLDETLVFDYMDRYSVDKRFACTLKLNQNNFTCDSYNHQYVNNQLVSIDHQILGTDGRVYPVVQDGTQINILSPDSVNTVLFSLYSPNRHFNALLFDPVGQMIVYQNLARIEVYDLQNDRPLARWDTNSSVSATAFSQDGRFIAVCRNTKTNLIWKYNNDDELYIFDVAQKNTLRKQQFDCAKTSMSFSPDGNILAVYSYFVKNPETVVGYSRDFFSGTMGARVMFLTTTQPFERSYAEVDYANAGYMDSLSYPVAFSTDSSFVAVACGNAEICFVDLSSEIVHRIQSQSYTSHLQFSPDGLFLSALSRIGTLSLFSIIDQ